MERAPVSLRRLKYLPDGRVRYQGTKFHPRLGTDHQLLPAIEFLALLVPHVLLRYQIIGRSYGAASTTFRRQAGWVRKPPTQAPPPAFLAPQPPPPTPEVLEPRDPPGPPTAAEGQEDESRRRKKRTWAKLIQKVWLCDPERCPTCGKPMKIIAAVCFPQQDQLIEKLLRHAGCWNPPWKRHRPARGPPPSAGSRPPAPTAGDSQLIDPPVEVEQYLADQPSGDDWTA
jgi:hypothetical protein